MTTFQEMEEHIAEAQRALDAADNAKFAVVLAPVASAHALLVIAECMLRAEMRASL